MRKKGFSLFAVALAVAFVSCGGGKGNFKADVTKMANYRCEIQKLMAQDQTSPDVQKKLESIQKEMGDYADKMEKKYADKKGDKSMDEEADKIMDEVMKNCK